ncbi:MAG: alpha/beta hydrolase [Gammaproteobacteria bacterium]|nr:alpha/beta hydrolase [Gammaproteobacteria bacterium]
MTNQKIDNYLESQYNVVAARSDFEHVLEDWTKRSQTYRTRSARYSQHRYGKRKNEVIDLFLSQQKYSPIMMYLHGGYWQRGDRSLYSFIAEPFNKAGINVAIIGYPFSPSVSILDIIDSIKTGVLWLWKNTREMDIDSNQILLVGHSAGGHLATVMQTQDWSELMPAMSDNPIQAIVSISGLYWLVPLCQTSLNENLNLDKRTAKIVSPTEMKPNESVPITMVFGDQEGLEFIRQCNMLQMAWESFGVPITRHKEDNADHFDVVDHIADDKSQLFQLIRQLAN